LAALCARARAFGTEADIKEQRTPVGPEQVGHPGIAAKALFGLLFDQDGQF
jgi:hypothetical protein